jgi:hypothetical protein
MTVWACPSPQTLLPLPLNVTSCVQTAGLTNVFQTMIDAKAPMTLLAPTGAPAPSPHRCGYPRHWGTLANDCSYPSP